MFYAQLILAKKGILGKVWLAAHNDRRLNRQVIFQTDITQSAGASLFSFSPFCPFGKSGGFGGRRRKDFSLGDCDRFCL